MEPIFKTPSDGHYFFGYYDKSPFDIDNVRMLSQRARFMDRMPEKDDVLEIGYFDWRSSNEFIKLTETKAWNWQQGCMLQWVGPDFKTNIIFNDRIDGKFVSVLMNVETNEKRILPMAVYSMHRSGKYAVCIDNERHYWFRAGYNYQGIENYSKRKSLDESDGIWLLDINENKTKQIINIVDLIKLNPLSNMKGANHYLEHLMFSPGGKRFCFLHRWNIADGGIYARFYTANMDGSDLFLLNDSGRMSHTCWKNEIELLAWCGLETPVNRLRKYKSLVKLIVKPFLPFYHKLITQNSSLSKMVSGDSYVLFQDKTKIKNRMLTDKLTEDGHPSFCPNSTNIFVSDTYQDNEGFRSLFLCDVENNMRIDVARLKSNDFLDNTAFRCDLHPKWSYSGEYISVDTVDSGFRQMYVYDVSKIVKR